MRNAKKHEVLSRVAGSFAAIILSELDIQCPVQAVFNASPPDIARQIFRNRGPGGKVVAGSVTTRFPGLR